MAQYQESRDAALKHIKLADHMYSVTLPMLKDPKLMMSVIDNISRSLTCIITAVLQYDREHSSIPRFEDSFSSKFTMFQMKSAVHHGLGDYVALIKEIQEITEQHKSSPIEFIRKDNFVICSENYALKSINNNFIQSSIRKTKEFFTAADNILKQ